MTLDERRQRILAAVDQAVLDVGAELLAAKREHPGSFTEWVVRSLPFGLDKAERLMAITRAFGSIDPSVRAALPPAWTAMFELSRLPIETVHEGIESGAITPTMTVSDARALVSGVREAPEAQERAWQTGPKPGERQIRVADADLLAAKLVREPRDTLTAAAEAQIRAWLDESTPQET